MSYHFSHAILKGALLSGTAKVVFGRQYLIFHHPVSALASSKMSLQNSAWRVNRGLLT